MEIRVQSEPAESKVNLTLVNLNEKVLTSSILWPYGMLLIGSTFIRSRETTSRTKEMSKNQFAGHYPEIKGTFCYFKELPVQ